MLRFFYIAIGGAIGALLRYWISGVANRLFYSEFPWGTLSVNLIGSLIIGFLWGISEFVFISRDMKVLIFIGILGSFTTFSTFSLESFHLLRDGEYGFLSINIFLNFFLGIVLVFAGVFLSRYIFNLTR